MANHKKRKPANARAGCKMCKYWKINGVHIESPEAEKYSDHKRRIEAREEIKEYMRG